MNIAVTGATGFLGRYIVSYLVAEGHHCRCWYRPSSDRSGLDAWHGAVDWVPGGLGDKASADTIVQGCQTLVHAALDHSDGAGRMAGRDFGPDLALQNIGGSLALFDSARAAGVERVIYISSCAVFGEILGDRPLDETHPLWPNSDYGAHKAAVEAFVSSLALDRGYPICSLRPTGIYGLAHPPRKSKWFDLVSKIVRGESVTCQRGGKEVHAVDVAQAVNVLLSADGIVGQAYNCCDRYVSEFDVATLAKSLSGSDSQIHGSQTTPKNQIATSKIRALGVNFGGEALLASTIGELIAAAKA